MTTFHQQAEQIYNALIEIEANASDDQLFLCSYLLGHISLISAESGNTATQFNEMIRNSLDKAYLVDQLSDEDISDINALWQQLLQCTEVSC